MSSSPPVPPSRPARSHPPAGSPATGEPTGDPWAAFGYLVSGVLFYGAVGYGLSVWLHISYLLPIGILVGAGFGMYLVFHRYRYRGEDGASPSAATPIENGRADNRRPDRDDRGETT